jgi:hypothetical protein
MTALALIALPLIAVNALLALDLHRDDHYDRKDTPK